MNEFYTLNLYIPCDATQPWGNSYDPGATPSVRSFSLGNMRVLSDEALVDVVGHLGERATLP